MNNNSPWNKKFAWFPVRLLNGKQVWFKYVYVRRCQQLISVGTQGMAIKTWYEYGTVFDVLAAK